MATHRKSILAATFGEYVQQDPDLVASYGGEDNIKKIVASLIQQASAAGFDVDTFAFNPQEPEDSIKRLEEKLRSRDWDGMLIGWGLRGNKSHTPLFEAAVNAAREVVPRTKLMFGNAPDDFFNTLQRNFEGLE
ncbi:hypothetical protein B0A55_04052 [Friedmanniomyces simplex]|uniref:Uncharacterized protein n=1 Tax=Friedmanniomyces simplex TaxID=329884 RepID=A0A4U0XK40_9PEZI|nr:hypothetical protein B0A55_04052 [Friedmanniomyces simplex]